MKRSAISFLSVVLVTVLIGFPHSEISASKRTMPTCTTVSPSALFFGLRGDANTQSITVTSNTTWGAYVSASWIKINGTGTISSGGNATVTVTLQGPIPPTRGYMCGGSESLGTITFYDGCGNTLQVAVTYITCPCC